MTDTATFNGIDLSRLPAPAVIQQLSYEQIRAEMVARVKMFIPDFDDTLESDPAVKVLEVAAYFRMLDRQSANDSCLAVMLPYAMGADLDQIGVRFGVWRLVLVPADLDAGTPATMEGDEALRQRILLAPEGYSVAGPSGSYIKHARDAAGDVLDASAQSPSAAVVVVHVLSRVGDGTASPALVEIVRLALSDETVRPVGDRLTVQSATIVTYAIEAALTFYPGPDMSIVLAQSLERARAYAIEQHKLGRDVTRSGIFAALHIPGVQNVNLISPPADIVIDDNEASYCTDIAVTSAGVAE
jgi:phage-related baseplate assembly protein